MSIHVNHSHHRGLDGDVTAHPYHETVLPPTVSAHFGFEKATAQMPQLCSTSSWRTHVGDLQPECKILAEGESCVKSRTKQESGLHQG